MNIYLTDTIKITNPLSKSDIYSYEGNLEEINFKHQQKNFELISEKLANFEIYFDYIWYGQFLRDNLSICHFVVRSNDNRIYWRKYEGNSKGSGQNFIYIDGVKYKTTSFLRLSNEELNNKLTQI